MIPHKLLDRNANLVPKTRQNRKRRLTPHKLLDRNANIVPKTCRKLQTMLDSEQIVRPECRS